MNSHLGQLKAKLAKLRKELVTPSSGGGGAGGEALLLSGVSACATIYLYLWQLASMLRGPVLLVCMCHLQRPYVEYLERISAYGFCRGFIGT